MVLLLGCGETPDSAFLLVGYGETPKYLPTLLDKRKLMTGRTYRWDRNMGEKTERDEGTKWIKVRKNGGEELF
jgi:hypothetical protein